MTPLTRDPQSPGYLWALIQDWMDAQEFPPSERKLAHSIGVSSSALNNWKFARHFPAVAHLERLTRATGIEYEQLLDGVLIDQGYRRPPAPTTIRPNGGQRRKAS